MGEQQLMPFCSPHWSTEVSDGGVSNSFGECSYKYGRGLKQMMFGGWKEHLFAEGVIYMFTVIGRQLDTL